MQPNAKYQQSSRNENSVANYIRSSESFNKMYENTTAAAIRMPLWSHNVPYSQHSGAFYFLKGTDSFSPLIDKVSLLVERNFHHYFHEIQSLMVHMVNMFSILESYSKNMWEE